MPEMIQCFIKYNLSTIFDFPCEYVYLTFIIIKLSYSTKVLSHLIQDYWNTQAIFIWFFQFISVHSMKRTDELLFITDYLLFTKQYRYILQSSLKWKNLSFPTQILSQVESKYWQFLFEESKFSIWECFGIVRLNGNKKFA